MNKNTKEYCLHILDEQKRQIFKGGATQEAFYKGMRLMFEIILTECYTNDKIVLFENAHKIKEHKNN